MKWFFTWLYNGLKEVEQQGREEMIYGQPATAGMNASNRTRKFSNLKVGLATAREEYQISLNQSAMVFKLYPATGGHIVEYSYYDEKKDQNNQALHLIPSDQDLGDALSKIMTLEALRR